ncbi:MAG: WYL domain-containing protein, partial [Rhodomicrobium sp.]
SRGEPAPRTRRLAPYGLLTGLRQYLVARPAEARSGPFRLYVVEKIRVAKVGGEAFVRDPDFNLQSFANRAFGAFQNEAGFGEVVWRFSPRAASRARGFEFHPAQVMEDQPDGSLIVRFSAAGHLEMAWHLYAWGHDVEVLAPEHLRTMVHAYRRADFSSLP